MRVRVGSSEFGINSDLKYSSSNNPVRNAQHSTAASSSHDVHKPLKNTYSFVFQCLCVCVCFNRSL